MFPFKGTRDYIERVRKCAYVIGLSKLLWAGLSPLKRISSWGSGVCLIIHNGSLPTVYKGVGGQSVG